MSSNYFSSVNNRKWSLRVIEERKVNKLIQDLEISDFLARFVSSRNIDIDKVEDFINPSIRKQLPSPLLLKDMTLAINRISKAFTNNENIAIFGDYDVDGATSSAVLYKSFKLFGNEPIIYIPDRLKEGYGPNIKALKKLKEEGIDLVVTVDCGMTSFKELDYAKNINLDVIVVDHHAPEAKLPDAIAVINPNRIDDNTGLGMLAAVGVSFMLVGALKSKLIELSKSATVGCHPGILPNYRGLETFFWALANGEKESGVSVFYLTEKVDVGKIIMQEKFAISHDETVKSIYEKLTKISAKLMSQTLHKISKGETFYEYPQVVGDSYYPMPTREVYKRFKQSGRKWK